MVLNWHPSKNKENIIINKLRKEAKKIFLELLKKILDKKILEKHIYLC